MATSGKIEQMGHKEIKKVKDDLVKLRKKCREIGKRNPDQKVEHKTAYRWRISKALARERSHKRKKAYQAAIDNRLHSLNPVKAARIQALREAWAKSGENSL